MSEIIRHIGDDVSEKAIEIEAEIELNIRVWGMQRLKGLLYLIRKLQFDK